MSRIIRKTQAQQTDDKEIKIQPFQFFQPHSANELGQAEQELAITREEILFERDRLLAEARQQIEMEKQQFANFQQQQLQMMEASKQQWEEEKLHLQQQAYDEGFAQGYEEGVQKANADMQQTLRTANEVMTNAQANAQKYLETQESVILELGITSAERIMNTVLAREEETFVSIVRRALKEAREMKEIKIYVSPEYYGVISKNRDELAEMFPPDVPFLIFVNEDLANAESYIETSHGRIVVSIDTQLNELRLKLREILDSKE
ncbi:flagellar assembly protein [Lysinibacillus odysseyi 34hs-1 = NBRC 100172]|uniref:Flagellar assembly protein FliH n=1 Tax=Lysinibacillus odysseyi 34hs-1 = NBRC 100172 TaxID=1220589 RepID=A0A0A3IU47_9BACI|nr:flagellar assembly protein FliH [Lysinibacillus odysseyi]KGR86413.1 flagellar assembly protein [Lysinibacillus odysseyi 34hs-1 = NBRC 100172]